MEIGRELIPFGGIDGSDFGDALGCFADGRAEAFIAHRSAREADDGVAFAERIVHGEVVHRGQDFALGQITGSAEENHRTGVGDTAVGHS